MQEMKVSGHIGWQIRNVLANMMGGKAVQYLEYLEPLGLLDGNEKAYMRAAKYIERQKQRDDAIKSIHKAEQILAMNRKQKGG